MTMTRSGRAGLILLGLSLCGFKPFTEAKTVCETCNSVEHDVLILEGNGEVRCTLVAQNDAYYVCERFNEYRAIPKASVASLQWKGRGARTLDTGDQAILKNGVAIHGRLQKQLKDKYVVIQSGAKNHVIWFSVTAAVYRDGKLIYSAPPAEEAAAPPATEPAKSAPAKSPAKSAPAKSPAKSAPAKPASGPTTP